MLLSKEKHRKEIKRQPRRAYLQAPARRRYENRMQQRAHPELLSDESQVADPSSDQSVFHNHHKDYGAYTAHPSYSSNLMMWLIIAGIAVAVAIGYPVISKLSGRGEIAPKALVKTLVQTELPSQPSLP